MYVKNYIDNKEVKTPGLKWFELVVRNTLLGFLIAQEIFEHSNDRAKELSLEYGVVRLQINRAAKAGSVLTEKDVN